VDYSTPGLADVVRERKDILNPDVDFQLAVLTEKAGMAGDALRIDLLNGLLSGKEEIARTAGLTLFGGAAPAAGGMMGLRGGPGKTTILPGLAGPAAIRDDLRWLEVYSKIGMGFLSLDRPDFLFRDGALSDEGKKLVDAAGRANLLLVVKGLDPARMKALLEAAKKPLFLETGAVLSEEILGLVKKTESTIGLVLEKDEDPAAYVKKIGEAKKTVGTEYLAIVSDRALHQSEGRDRMIGVISELFKAKYGLEDLTNLFSAAFMRALNRAVRP
jgi:microsomal dipeptidase-like Zn-dependent dipeptidase